MVYSKVENKEIIKTGTVFEMETRNSNPTLLSELELRAMNIYKVQPFANDLTAWEYFGSSSYVYDSDTDTVREIKEILVKDLEAFKQEKLTQLKQTHEQIKTEGFTTSTGIKIGCEDKDKTALLDQLQRIERKSLTGSPLVDYDNNVHNLSLADFETLVLELGDYLYKLFMDKQTLRGIINAYTTHEQVNEIYWRKALLDENNVEVIGYNYNPILN